MSYEVGSEDTFLLQIKSVIDGRPFWSNWRVVGPPQRAFGRGQIQVTRVELDEVDSATFASL